MAKTDVKTAPAAQGAPGENLPATAPTAGIVGAYDYGEDAGAGFEGVKSADLSIPFLSILQGLSPQVEKNDPPGSRPGLLYNTVTREIIDGEKGIVVVPCHKEMCYVEWRPRKKGGGFIGLHGENEPEVKKAIEAVGKTRVSKIPFGENELVETHYVYALVLEEDGVTVNGFVVISFTSTKIKPYRGWLTSMYLLRGKPPIFANRARLKTVKQQNDQGVFFNFSIEPFAETWIASLINPVKEKPVLEAATKFREMVLSGAARAAYETLEGGADEGDSATEGGRPATAGKPPF